MSWYLVLDDSFSHADTSAGGADSTTGVPTTPANGAANGWTDLAGGIYSISSDNLVANAPSGGPQTNILLRQAAAENGNPDSRIVATTSGSLEHFGIVFRYVDSNNFYLLECGGGFPNNYWYLYSYIGGSVTTITNDTFSGSYAHQFSFDFQAVGTSPTTFNLIINDVTASTEVYNNSTTDSSSVLQASGLPIGLDQWDGETQTFSDVQVYNAAECLWDIFDRAAGYLMGSYSNSGHLWGPTGEYRADLTGAGSIDDDESAEYGGYGLNYTDWTPAGTDYSASATRGSTLPGVSGQYVDVGPLIRASGGGGSVIAYWFHGVESYGSTSTFSLDYMTGQYTGTTIATFAVITPIAAGDVFTVTAVGTSPVVLTCYQNGVEVGTYSDSSGTAITVAGSAGVGLFTGSMNGYGNDIITAVYGGPIGTPTLTISPSAPTVAYSGDQSFTVVGALINETINLTVVNGSVSPSSGTSTEYTAPGSGSTDTLIATSGNMQTHNASAAITLGTTSYYAELT